MAGNQKAIKARIKSVKNTKKLTKAMEMVSAAKMRKSVEGALNTRTYAKLARELMEHLSFIDEPNVALLEHRSVKNILVILVSSNRGLCGSFNTNLFKQTGTLLEDTANVARHRGINGDNPEPADNVDIHIIGLGKKSAGFAKKNGYDLVGVYDKISERPDIEDLLPISDAAIKGYTDGTYDKVLVAYTDFVSSLVQEPKLRQLLPVTAVDLEKMLKETGDNITSSEQEETKDFPIESYLFEPTFEEVLDYVLPRLVEVQLYQAVLESSASEHSARMVAMKNASEAAGDMIYELNLSYNKARQANITQEIAEIAGGAAALE